MARISLDHCLSRLTKGNSSDPDYVVQVLKAAVDLKVESAVRLEKQIQEIADTLTISYKEAASMTYGEMSILIHRMWNMGGENRYRAIEVMFNLAAPFYIENRRRRRKNA